MKKRVLEYLAFLAFLELMQREISCSLATAESFGRKCTDKTLVDMGFVGALKDGESLSAAFLKTDGKSYIAAADRKLLFDYFNGFGLGSLDTELASLAECIKSFSARARSEEGLLSSRVKLAMTLLWLFWAAVTILLM